MPVSGHLARRSAEFVATFQDKPQMKLDISPWLIFLVLGVIFIFGLAAFAVSLFLLLVLFLLYDSISCLNIHH